MAHEKFIVRVESKSGQVIQEPIECKSQKEAKEYADFLDKCGSHWINKARASGDSVNITIIQKGGAE